MNMHNSRGWLCLEVCAPMLRSAGNQCSGSLVQITFTFLLQCTAQELRGSKGLRCKTGTSPLDDVGMASELVLKHSRNRRKCSAVKDSKTVGMEEFVQVSTWVSCTTNWSMSGIPSPEMADVGTMFTYFLGSGFFQYSATFSPCSFKFRIARCRFVSNSLFTCGCCRCKASRIPVFAFDSHSNSLSTCVIKGIVIRCPHSRLPPGIKIWWDADGLVSP